MTSLARFILENAQKGTYRSETNKRHGKLKCSLSFSMTFEDAPDNQSIVDTHISKLLGGEGTRTHIRHPYKSDHDLDGNPYIMTVDIDNGYEGVPVRGIDRLIYRGDRLYRFYKTRFLRTVFQPAITLGPLRFNQEFGDAARLDCWKTLEQLEGAFPSMENPLVRIATFPSTLAESVSSRFRKSPRKDPLTKTEQLGN